MFKEVIYSLQFLVWWSLLLDTEMESCEEERSLLKRRLSASAIEIERQVIAHFSCHRVQVDMTYAEQTLPYPMSICRE